MATPEIYDKETTMPKPKPDLMQYVFVGDGPRILHGLYILAAALLPATKEHKERILLTYDMPNGLGSTSSNVRELWAWLTENMPKLCGAELVMTDHLMFQYSRMVMLGPMPHKELELFDYQLTFNNGTRLVVPKTYIDELYYTDHPWFKHCFHEPEVPDILDPFLDQP